MPLLWKHLLSLYGKIFFMVFLGFAGIGLFLRSKAFIAMLTSGASALQSLLSPLYSLLFLLPLLIGFSSLIASFLTTHYMSSSKEISVLSSYGLRLREIFAPLFPCMLILAALNFFLVAEVIPYSKTCIRKVYLSSHMMNPLLLLCKKAIPFLSKSYIEIELDKEGERGENLLFFYFDEQKEALSLVTGAELSYENREFVGKDCSFLRYIPSEKEGFDHLVLTEEKEVVLNAPFFSSFAKKRHRTRSYDLSLKELWQDPTEKGILKMVKRLSQTLLPITFGLLGIAFGLIAPKRKTPKAPYLVLALLILFYFSCHFLAKKLPLPLASAALFLLPHLLLLSSSFTRLLRYQKGGF